jgi:glycosyltransferase involved in cell wall biosynthesis
MQEKPLVSVLVTSYNAMPYLVNAVEGIINQTYTNWELIVIDDHSSDNTMDYLNSLENEKIIVKLNTKKGRGTALNFGLSHCKGKYIAINDADDYSLPNRLDVQVAFLESNSNVGLVGAHSILKNYLNGEIIPHERPTTELGIKVAFTKGQPIQHVTIMARRNIIEAVGGYNEKIKFLFDRDIFLRIAAISQLSNLKDMLVEVGHHDNRFFYYQFKGFEREWLSFKYKVKAIRMFGFPKIWIVKTFFISLFSLLPINLRMNIIKFIKQITWRK